jgi:hypothetical protein
MRLVYKLYLPGCMCLSWSYFLAVWPHTDQPDALSDLVTMFGRTLLIPSVCAKGEDSVIVHSFAVDYFLLRFYAPNSQLFTYLCLRCNLCNLAHPQHFLI